MPEQPPTTETADAPDAVTGYDWEMVIACGVALLLQSRWDGEPVRELLGRATGDTPDPDAMSALWAYARRTLEPMK